jgi:hypothetical protein
MSMKRLFVALAALTLVAGACGANDASTFETASESIEYEDVAVDGPEQQGEPAAVSQPDGIGLDKGVVQTAGTVRKIITNVNLSLVGEDPEALYDQAVALATAAGGFVSNAQLSYPYGDTESDPYVSFTLRVPSTDVETTLAAIEGLADRVIERSIFTDDVTEQYVDLEARIENLRLLEGELQELLGDVRQAGSSDTEDLIRVFNEVSRVRGDLEVLEGRQRLLNDQVDLATIQISVEPKSEFIPFVDEWKPLQVAKSALTDLVQWLKQLGDFVIRLVVLNGPMLLILAVVAYVLVWRPLKWVLRRVESSSKNSDKDVPDSEEEDGPSEDTVDTEDVRVDLSE